MSIRAMTDDFQDRAHAKSMTPRLRRFWATRARRRRYAVLLVLVILAGTVLFAVLPSYAGTAVGIAGLLPVTIVLMCAVAVLSTQLGLATYASSGHRNLDERQRVEMDRATQIGHRFTAALLMATFLLIAFGTTFSPESVVFPEQLLLPLLWVILMAHSVVPVCYLAWTQPDEVLDDEDEPAVA